MKSQSFLLVIMLVCGHGLAGSASAQVAGLAARWKLAGDAQDSSGNGRHAVNVRANLEAEGRTGKPSKAAQFDGKDSRLEVPADRAPALATQEFSITGYLQTTENSADDSGEIISQYDPVRRRGFSLGITHNTGVTTSQSNTRNLHFGIDNDRIEPHWTDHGRPGNALLPFALAVYRGQLFAGTCEPGRNESGHVYRLEGDARWIDCGSPHPCNSVSALCVFQGRLYAGVSKYRVAGSALAESENTHLGGKVYRYDGDGKWIDCGQLPQSEAIGGLVVFRGQLYASSLYKPAGFFRYEGEQAWTALEVPDGKRVESMGVYNDQLFATSYDLGHVYRYDGKKWVDCGQVGEDKNTQTYAFAVYYGKLYVATWASGKVFRYDGDQQWKDVGRLGEELEVMGMLVHNGQLFAGTLPLAEVYRYDGKESWQRLVQLDQTPDVKYRRAWTMAQYRGRMFCGTLPSGKVWSIQAGRSVTYDDELPAGWRHLAAVRAKDRLKLYIDGRLVATSAPFAFEEYDLTVKQPLQIGFGPKNSLRGSLSDLRIYDRALSDDEILKVSRE